MSWSIPYCPDCDGDPERGCPVCDDELYEDPMGNPPPDPGCVLGDKCLCPHVGHTCDECFDITHVEHHHVEPGFVSVAALDPRDPFGLINPAPRPFTDAEALQAIRDCTELESDGHLERWEASRRQLTDERDQLKADNEFMRNALVQIARCDGPQPYPAEYRQHVAALALRRLDKDGAA